MSWTKISRSLVQSLHIRSEYYNLCQEFLFPPPRKLMKINLANSPPSQANKPFLRHCTWTHPGFWSSVRKILVLSRALHPTSPCSCPRLARLPRPPRSSVGGWPHLWSSASEHKCQAGCGLLTLGLPGFCSEVITEESGLVGYF